MIISGKLTNFLFAVLISRFLTSFIKTRLDLEIDDYSGIEDYLTHVFLVLRREFLRVIPECMAMDFYEEGEPVMFTDWLKFQDVVEMSPNTCLDQPLSDCLADVYNKICAVVSHIYTLRLAKILKRDLELDYIDVVNSDRGDVVIYFRVKNITFEAVKKIFEGWYICEFDSEDEVISVRMGKDEWVSICELIFQELKFCSVFKEPEHEQLGLL